MERIADFKPLQRVTLPGLGDLVCTGLIMVVGPNSSGKSQLLHDVYETLAGEPRALVVATDVSIDKPEWEPFMKCLEKEGYLRTFVDDNGEPQIRPLTTFIGSGQGIGQIAPSQAQSWHSQFSTTSGPRRRSEYLNYFGRLLVTALFLDRRLSSMNQVGVIDFETQPPQHDLHALYLDDEAKQALFEEMRDSFGKAVWPDSARGNLLSIRVSDSPVLPAAEDRLSPTKMALFRTIESEGDGMKSYVATCVSLLLGRRPVCIIDEPEMCLHPPQAYRLGRFIGTHGASRQGVTLVATHSSQVLRGAIQVSPDMQIIRMTRDQSGFAAHLVPADVLKDALSRPTMRAESVLDGIFAQSVVVIEGDGDRLVYQTVWETLKDELDLDVHFAAVGGTGGIADICRLYRILRIPVAVVADLDIVADSGRLKRILLELAPQDVVEGLVNTAKSIMNDICRLPPTIEPSELSDTLAALSGRELSWQSDDDISVRQELNRLSKRLDRMRVLKRGGVLALDPPIAEPLKALLGELALHGLFVVPLGELEEWLADYGIVESKNGKWAWASAAATAIQSVGVRDGDVWDFVRAVAAFLTQGEISARTA